MTRLVVLLGAGGVGKTTLSAGLGLALARVGRRVGLLGIDPARRLRTALGLTELLEEGTVVPAPGGAGQLRAGVLRPEESLRRWLAESCHEEDVRARLVASPFFVALADHLADATDAIAAVRIVEWVERDPALDDLVVDTAPGVPAIEFLARPDKLLAFLDGKLIRWLRRFAGLGGRRRGGGRLLGGLARVSGARALRDLGEFTSLIEDALARMAERLERARRWLRDPATIPVLVCGVSLDAAAVALRLAAAVREVGVAPRIAVVNRALPESLVADPPAPPFDGSPAAIAFVRYVQGCCRVQRQVRRDLDRGFGRVVELPGVVGLDAAGAERLPALASLGEGLRAALEVD